MKRIAIALVLTLVAFAATSSFAQAGSLRFDVPFGFSADGKHYSAGQYQLCTVSSGTTQLRQLRNLKTGDSSLIMLKSPINAGIGAAAPKVRFAVNGEYGYLTSLTDHSGTTWKVPVAERDLEASRGSNSKEVAIAAIK
jgi:hypothetical protein